MKHGIRSVSVKELLLQTDSFTHEPSLNPATSQLAWVGTSVANYNSSNLIKHLKTHHVKEHHETVLRKLYETVREHISWRLEDVQAIGFTTDMRTSNVSLLILHTGFCEYVLRQWFIPSVPKLLNVVRHSSSARFYLSQATKQKQQSYHIHTGLIVYRAVQRKNKISFFFLMTCIFSIGW